MLLVTENLSSVLDREREMSDQASDLADVGIPFHYNAIAHLLLKQYVPVPTRLCDPRAMAEG